MTKPLTASKVNQQAEVSFGRKLRKLQTQINNLSNRVAVLEGRLRAQPVEAEVVPEGNILGEADASKSEG